MFKNKQLLVILGIFIALFINLFLIVSIHLSWDKSMRKYFSLQYEIKELEKSLSEAHLWLEEAISGDTTINIEKDVFIPLQHKSFHLYVKSFKNKFTSEEDILYLNKLKNIEIQLYAFTNMANNRWLNTKDNAIGSKIDQEFDTDFKKILDNLNRLTIFINKNVQINIEHKNITFTWLIVFFLFINLFVIIIFLLSKKEQKKLEDELRASKKQFELFMNNLPFAIVIKDESKKVIYANKNVQKYLTKDTIGYTSTENLGNKIGSKVDTLINKATKHGKVEEVIHGILNNKDYTARVLVFRIPQSNGKMYTGIVYVDITQGYQAQHEISKLRSALDRSPISVMMTDIDGNIEYVNPNYTKVSGYSLKELIGENPRIVKSGYTSDKKYEEMWAHISSGHTWTADIKNIAKDGSEFWEDSTIIPSFNESGEVDGYIAFKLEITEKVYLREELKHKEEIIMLQSRHAAMGEMISMIAHQWRQPLSIIAMGANNILADVELHMVEEKSLITGAENIIDQTQELSKTIDDFRNFFRPEKIAQEILPEDIFNEAFGVIGKSLENSNIEIVSEFKNGKKIITYSRELMQVFINILKNANEVLAERREKKRKIFISIVDNNNEVLIKICANAGGIKEEIITKIFNPYFSTKNKANGTGLGLYMSKTIVEKHLNGTITAYNKDEGACFEIRLPLKIDKNNEE